MHVISYRRLREYAEKHADVRDALDNWYKVASKVTWGNLIEVQEVFPKAEAVSNFTVFNIKGILSASNRKQSSIDVVIFNGATRYAAI